MSKYKGFFWKSEDWICFKLTDNSCLRFEQVSGCLSYMTELPLSIIFEPKEGDFLFPPELMTFKKELLND